MVLYRNEKRLLNVSHPRPASPQRSLIRAALTQVLVFALAISLFLNYRQWCTTELIKHHRAVNNPHYGSTKYHHSSPDDNPSFFNWTALDPKSYLNYKPCYNHTYQCARLELPMDYWNASTASTVAVAVIRLPAAVPVSDPRYGGAVLVNPGGPGGSGVGFVQRAGQPILDTINAAKTAGTGGSSSGGGTVSAVDGKFYDLIGFDPRGIGASTPNVRCPGTPGLDKAWQVRIMEEGVMGASDAALGRLWAMSRAKAESCSLPNAAAGEADIREFVSTAAVARDMVGIVEAHGRWREEEAERLVVREAEARERLRWKKGEEKLQYWGFSYGTYLGLTYASMFPDRIERLVVDGVVDLEDYTKGLWYDNLVDTEKVMASFYDNCARAGYPACALANEDGATTSEEVETKVKNITTSLYHNPLPVIGDAPEVISYSDVKNLIFAAVYTPQKSFPWVASLLADISRGDGTAFAKLLRPYHELSCPASDGGTAFHLIPLHNITKQQSGPALHSEATMAVACGDGDDMRNTTREEFARFLADITRESPTLGPMWSMLHLHCIHYHIRAQYRFTGPWAGNTSHPILLIGNTADPVTPLQNAIKFANRFEGAVALTQNSPGHCSSSTACRCTKKLVNRYFQTGELPAKGTVCQPDERPFGAELVVEEAEIAEINLERERSGQIWDAVRHSGGGFMMSQFGAETSIVL